MSINRKLKTLFHFAAVFAAVFFMLATLISCEQVEDLAMKKGSLKVIASLKSSDAGKVDLANAEYVFSITKDGATSTLQGQHSSIVFADIPAGNYKVSAAAYVEGSKVAEGTIDYEVTVAASTQSECRVYLSAISSGGSESGEGGSGGSGSAADRSRDPARERDLRGRVLPSS